MNMPRPSAFRLIPESVDAGQNTNGSRAKLDAIEVPAGCSFLPASPSDRPSFLTALPDSPDDGFVLEPVLNGQRQRRLMLVNPMAGRLRVNAGPAPRIALLREGDQFQFDESRIFHLAIFNRPQIGPAPAEKVGKPCPICLTPFSADPNCICYTCPSCTTVLHLEDCARAVRECGHCHQPISFEEGYSWLPNIES